MFDVLEIPGNPVVLSYWEKNKKRKKKAKEKEKKVKKAKRKKKVNKVYVERVSNECLRL